MDYSEGMVIPKTARCSELDDLAFLVLGFFGVWLLGFGSLSLFGGPGSCYALALLLVLWNLARARRVEELGVVVLNHPLLPLVNRLSLIHI